MTDSEDKVEVLEFFWYGCPHCMVFDPILDKWMESKPENAEFARVPAIFRPEWEVHARTYYALQIIDEGERLHDEIFHEIQKKRKKLETEGAVTKFVVSNGVNEKDFKQAYSSFTVDNMIRKAKLKIKGYNIRGVPAMAVNGKYLVTGEKAKSYENMLRIVNFLVEKESSEDKN